MLLPSAARTGALRDDGLGIDKTDLQRMAAAGELDLPDAKAEDMAAGGELLQGHGRSGRRRTLGQTGRWRENHQEI